MCLCVCMCVCVVSCACVCRISDLIMPSQSHLAVCNCTCILQGYLVDLVHHMGGSVRRDMTPKVTHLIANCTGGEKYKVSTQDYFIHHLATILCQCLIMVVKGTFWCCVFQCTVNDAGVMPTKGRQ